MASPPRGYAREHPGEMPGVRTIIAANRTTVRGALPRLGSSLPHTVMTFKMVDHFEKAHV
jgi:hypothetical protein